MAASDLEKAQGVKNLLDTAARLHQPSDEAARSAVYVVQQGKRWRVCFSSLWYTATGEPLSETTEMLRTFSSYQEAERHCERVRRILASLLKVFGVAS